MVSDSLGASLLPPLINEGWLPPGRHPATVDELYQQFVVDAPHRASRELIFRAFELWVARSVDILGAGILWVDGGFVTHKVAAPHDLDVVLFPNDLAQAEKALLDGSGYELLTLQDILFTLPHNGGWLRRHQPIGGWIDAFLARVEDAPTWHHLWSSVKDPDGEILANARKGYVELEIVQT